MRGRHVRRMALAVIGVALIGVTGYWALARPAGVPAGRVARLPNILLISIDTLRADHLGSYGYQRPTSPAIDALAARGVLFAQAYSHSPKTAISHMSIMTGLLPEAHGVEQWNAEGSERLSDDIPTLATLLKPHGYHTFAITGGGHVRGELGFDQGMESYETEDDVTQTFARVGDRIARHLTAAPDTPFFAFVHTYEVHDPYAPQPPYRTLFTDPTYSGKIIGAYDVLTKAVGRDWQAQHDWYWQQVDADDPRDVQHLQDLYDGSIRLTDDQIGKLIDRLRDLHIADETLIIFLADHGEEFLEHGRFQHEQVYQELLHVPLIMVFPGERGNAYRGRHEAAVVRLIDVLPTVLDAIGLEVPAHVQGVSLMPLLNGGAPPPVEVMSSWREDGWQALRLDDLKLIRQRTEGKPLRQELYVLSEDVGERHNVWEARPAQAQQLEARLEQNAARSRAFLAGQRRNRQVVPSQDTLERLRALGY